MLQVGSHSSISDLTDATGWTVLDCDATARAQDIRVVCDNAGLCYHFYTNGAEYTVARLPDEVSVLLPAVAVYVDGHRRGLCALSTA